MNLSKATFRKETELFTSSFVFTPKSPQEAKTTKDIIDTFTFYSVPGLGSAAIQGQPGQYLTPPQLFKIKLVFLGKSGLMGTLQGVYQSALNSIGLGFLNTNNPTDSIASGSDANTTFSKVYIKGDVIDLTSKGSDSGST